MKWRQILNSRQFPFGMLGIGLLPFFILAFFTYPVSDDYSFFIDTQSRSFLEFLNWGYTHLSGRYTAIAITGLLNPLSSHSFWLYRVFVFAIFIGFNHSAFLFFKEGAKRLGIVQAKLVAGIMLLYWWLLMPNTAELVYWYSSSYSYTIGLIGMFYWGYFLMKENKLMACILPVFIAGTCELAAILMLVVVVTLFVYHITRKIKLPKYYYAVLTSVVIFSMVGLLSPGNFHRSEGLAAPVEDFAMHKLNLAIGTVVKSFDIAVDFFLLNLFTVVIVIILAIATPGYRPSQQVKTGAKYMLFGSLGVIPLILFPYYWVFEMDFIPLRIINYAFIAFSILYIPALLIYYKPYFGSRWYKNKMKYAVVFTSLVYVGFRSNLRYAVTDLVNMSTYKQQVDNRYKVLADNKGNIVFDGFTYYPNTILHMDLDTSATHWYNRSLAKYYGVKSVVRK